MERGAKDESDKDFFHDASANGWRVERESK